VGKDDRLKLTPGSQYRITSMMTRDEPLVTEGTFKGYTMVGNIDALLMDIAPPAKGGSKAKGKAKAKGKSKAKAKEELRLLPAQMIISIDILDQAEEKEEEEQRPTSRYYY
jgi:hypothetical protein